MKIEPKYDITVVGSGHNGLVSACYLARAGMSVLVLERNEEVGGATRSTRPFPGVDAKLSVYSYLVSLFPEKIESDLGLNLQLRSRKTASWTPAFEKGKFRELLIRNDSDSANEEAFRNLTGAVDDYRGYRELQSMQETLASAIWPTLTSPLMSRESMRNRLGRDGRQSWDALIEEPVGNIIERLIHDDLIRGLVFTDGRIGVSTYPHDPSLLQNRSFLYHVIGRGTGEWRVPVGGMGALTDELVRVATATGNVTIATGAEVSGIGPGKAKSTVVFDLDEKQIEVDSNYVLCNASAQVLSQLLGEPTKVDDSPVIEGAGFKMNLLLEKLPEMITDGTSCLDAFAGTVHINEGYEQMLTSYRESMDGEVPSIPPGEIYCHTLTDDSILSDSLNQLGYHTLTLFGLDMPYQLFTKDNERIREEVKMKYLAGINQYLAEPIESCLAKDANGKLCIEAMSAFDLERKIHLPKGNIFHGDLTWPFTDNEDEVGEWGVETGHDNIFLCGSAAKRGGAVSGIPGHNAAMKILEAIR